MTVLYKTVILYHVLLLFMTVYQFITTAFIEPSYLMLSKTKHYYKPALIVIFYLTNIFLQLRFYKLYHIQNIALQKY